MSRASETRKLPNSLGDIVKSTTADVPGHIVTRYLGLVTAEACMAPEELKNLKAFIQKVEGGRHPEFERMMRIARNEALASLETEARELGANAIIGIDFDFSHLSDVGLLMLAVSGTAVMVEDKRNM